jgi:tRNA A-37 threonylcarbamoyl transferase component Bud32
VKEKMHIKIVSEKELTITRIASELGVGAELLSSEPLEDGKYRIGLHKYPNTLDDLYQAKRYTEYNTYLLRAKELLQKLHGVGIFQGDLSEENIICDPATHEVRVIDFGMSYFASEVVHPIDIPYYQDLYYECVRYAGEPTPTLNYLCRLELGCLEFLRWKH